MRIHHVTQAVKAWPDDTAENRAEAARLADVVEAHIRWRLWHGQVQRALDLIGDTLRLLEAMANDVASPIAVQAGKVAEVLRSLETYVSGQSGSSSTMRKPGAVESRSRRRAPRARCNGCCIGG